MIFSLQTRMLLHVTQASMFAQFNAQENTTLAFSSLKHTIIEKHRLNGQM